MKYLKSILIVLFICILAGCQQVNPQGQFDKDTMGYKISDERYEIDNLDILIELKIITEEDLNKDKYITNSEVLEILHKINVYEDYDIVEENDLSEWYRESGLEPLDTITLNDILIIKLNDNITNYEALRYITRMIGDTYGCTDYPKELDFTKKSQTYDAALKKGIIDHIDIASADSSIPRIDFLKLYIKRYLLSVLPEDIHQLQAN